MSKNIIATFAIAAFVISLVNAYAIRNSIDVLEKHGDGLVEHDNYNKVVAETLIKERALLVKHDKLVKSHEMTFEGHTSLLIMQGAININNDDRHKKQRAFNTYVLRELGVDTAGDLANDIL